MSGIVLKRSSHTVLLAQEYTYDDASNVLTHKKDSVTTTYTYDYINQLLSEDRGSYSCDYTYDANGNRLTRTLGSTTEDYICDSGDKLTEIKVGSTTIKSFSYDTAGRTTGITYSGSTTTLAYDYESRVTSITRSGVTTNTNSYNGLDTRVISVDSAGTRSLQRSGAAVTSPVIQESLAGATTYHTPGISEKRGAANSTYMHRGLKSFENQSGSGQTILASRQYDAFGNISSSSGSWQGPFGYGGSYGYQETGDHGLRLLGHRYNDSSTGRFLTRDPIKNGTNWYSYCRNNPLRYSDPTGLLTWNDVSDFAAGWGDSLTKPPFYIGWLKDAIGVPGHDSATEAIRTLIGVEQNVDHDSASYGAGGIAGAVNEAAIGWVTASPKFFFWKVENEWFGSNLTMRGKSALRFDIQQWRGADQPWWQYPHFNAKDGRHLPWQWFKAFWD